MEFMTATGMDVTHWNINDLQVVKVENLTLW